MLIFGTTAMNMAQVKKEKKTKKFFAKNVNLTKSLPISNSEEFWDILKNIKQISIEKHLKCFLLVTVSMKKFLLHWIPITPMIECYDSAVT